MDLMEKIVSLCKRRGFVYPGSEIYGGLANSWDYGPLGVEMKNNIRDSWWKTFVHQREDIYGIDGSIISHPKVWVASGHVEHFTEPLVECKVCHKRFKVENTAGSCPECSGELTKEKMFNGLFKTFVGPTEDTSSIAYLRPETAQSIFINFKNIVDSFHPKLPFGIAQFGRSFRNEITAGNFIFRDLEFDQMEIEYFIDPQSNWKLLFDDWLLAMKKWLKETTGVAEEKIRVREHGDKERSHYSKRTVDIEYEYPFGRKEVWGLAYRTDFDLKQHQKYSGVSLSYHADDGREFVPHVIEPSFGMPRTMLIALLEAYSEEGERTVLRLHPQIAPYKVAVFPLVANKEDLIKKAREIYLSLKSDLVVTFDERGNIGKRYYSQDEIGTPWCVTVDYQTLEDNTVTVRDRDTTKQVRLPVDKLLCYFQNELKK